MTSNGPEKLRQIQTEALYAAVGRFSVHFEQLCNAMSNAVQFALYLDGLKTQRIGQAILADLTADPLRRIFAAVFMELAHDDTEKELTQALDRRIQRLIEQRDNILHRTWFVGWAGPGEADFSRADASRAAAATGAPRPRPLEFNMADFDALTDEASALNEYVGVFFSCLSADAPLTKNLALDVAGNLFRMSA